MKPKKEPTAAKFAEHCSDRWNGRLARIGVFERAGEAMNDYWIACGVPLQEISLRDENGRMVFGLRAGEYRHEIEEPRRISFHFSPSGEEDGIDVAETPERSFTVRFEKDTLGSADQ